MVGNPRQRVALFVFLGANWRWLGCHIKSVRLTSKKLPHQFVGTVVGFVVRQSAAVNQRHGDVAFPRQHEAVIRPEGALKVADGAACFPVLEVPHPATKPNKARHFNRRGR